MKKEKIVQDGSSDEVNNKSLKEGGGIGIDTEKCL